MVNVRVSSSRECFLKWVTMIVREDYDQRGERLGGRSNFVSGRLRQTSLALSGVVLSAGFVSQSVSGNGATGGGQRKGTKKINQALLRLPFKPLTTQLQTTGFFLLYKTYSNTDRCNRSSGPRDCPCATIVCYSGHCTTQKSVG